MKFKMAALLLLLSSNFCMTLKIDAASLPNGVSKYKGHYYKVYNRSLNWYDAKDYCENMDGHLVTITSLNEQIFIYDLLDKNGNKNCYWLGGRKNSDNIWYWVTDEKTVYFNWAKDQPDNFTKEEDCLMMYRRSNPLSASILGQWNDICWNGACNNEEFFGVHNFGFICEWDSKKKLKNGMKHHRDDEHYEDNPDDHKRSIKSHR